jgi:hypothetical protein
MKGGNQAKHMTINEGLADMHYFNHAIGDFPVTPETQLVRTEQLHETLRMTSLCVMTSFTLLSASVQGE